MRPLGEVGVKNVQSIFLACVLGLGIPNAYAEIPIFEIEIKQHLFFPSEIIIPSGVKVKLLVYNRDRAPEEFESYELNREKIIMGDSKATIFIGPLPSGEYPFFGEFHPKTALGKIIAQ